MHEVIRRFKRGPFVLSVTAYDDDDLDLPFDDDGEVARKLDDGELVAFRVEAELSLLGRVLATEHLGGCVYESPRAFMDHVGLRRQEHEHWKQTGERVSFGSYFADMVRTVIKDGREEARKIVSELQSVKLREVKSEEPG